MSYFETIPVQFLLSKWLFGTRSGATPNLIPLKYRCLIKRSNRIRAIYLIPHLGRHGHKQILIITIKASRTPSLTGYRMPMPTCALKIGPNSLEWARCMYQWNQSAKPGPHSPLQCTSQLPKYIEDKECATFMIVSQKKDSHMTLGPTGPKSRVPSPTHVSKSQHGGKVPTCEPQVTIKNMVNFH